LGFGCWAQGLEVGFGIWCKGLGVGCLGLGGRVLRFGVWDLAFGLAFRGCSCRLHLVTILK